MPSSQEPIADYLAYLVASAHRNLHLELERRLKAEGVQVEHWRILEVLSDGEGRSMGDIARLVLMNHPALTKLVDKMVAGGLVHRTPSSEDMRRVLLRITDRGQDLFRRLQPYAKDHNERVSGILGTRKAATLKKLLNELISETTAH